MCSCCCTKHQIKTNFWWWVKKRVAQHEMTWNASYFELKDESVVMTHHRIGCFIDAIFHHTRLQVLNFYMKWWMKKCKMEWAGMQQNFELHSDVISSHHINQAQTPKDSGSIQKLLWSINKCPWTGYWTSYCPDVLIAGWLIYICFHNKRRQIHLREFLCMRLNTVSTMMLCFRSELTFIDENNSLDEPKQKW